VPRFQRIGDIVELGANDRRAIVGNTHTHMGSSCLPGGRELIVRSGQEGPERVRRQGLDRSAGPRATQHEATSSFPPTPQIGFPVRTRGRAMSAKLPRSPAVCRICHHATSKPSPWFGTGWGDTPTRRSWMSEAESRTTIRWDRWLRIPLRYCIRNHGHRRVRGCEALAT
jgi:hypothetical protein